MQGPGKPLASAKTEAGSSTPSGPVGAFTGLDLPKAVLKIRQQQQERADPAPERRAPLERGLPNTPITACQEFMLAIAVQGMLDRDLGYVESPAFIMHLCYVGLDIDTAVRVQTEYLMGRVDVGRLSHIGMPQTRRLATPGP